MPLEEIISSRGRIILRLAEENALVGGVKISTAKLAEEIGISQQSASRLLLELEREGIIERETSGRGAVIRLTDKALELILSLHAKLREVLERPSEITLTGRVFTGLGEGAYYVQIPFYMRQFDEKLGFKPYPGTLNLRLIGRDDVLKRALLERAARIEIERFSDGRRSYGGARCIKARVGDDEAAILFIERTHYPRDVIEILSPVCLREKLGLKDGDIMSVKVSLSPLDLA
jgi:riboflavin kinase